MDHQHTITAFTQSEKVKAGLIWSSQVLEFAGSLAEPEKNGSLKTAAILLDMVDQEVKLAGAATGFSEWKEAEDMIARAAAMLHSGVGSEAVPLLTRALSRVTTIGERSMGRLRDQGLL